MGPELTTKRLTMRGPLPSDLEDLFAIYSDSRAMTYWSTPPHPDTKETQAHLDRWLNGFDRPSRTGYRHWRSPYW